MGFEADMERLTKALPKNDDDSTVNLGIFNDSACKCANQLLKLVEDQKKKNLHPMLPRSHPRKLKRLNSMLLLYVI
jgi:hypothetical protein